MLLSRHRGMSGGTRRRATPVTAATSNRPLATSTIASLVQFGAKCVGVPRLAVMSHRGTALPTAVTRPQSPALLWQHMPRPAPAAALDNGVPWCGWRSPCHASPSSPSSRPSRPWQRTQTLQHDHTARQPPGDINSARRVDEARRETRRHVSTAATVAMPAPLAPFLYTSALIEWARAAERRGITGQRQCATGHTCWRALLHHGSGSTNTTEWVRRSLAAETRTQPDQTSSCLVARHWLCIRRWSWTVFAGRIRHLEACRSCRRRRSCWL